MQVIGHEAVRNNREPLFGRTSLNLQQHQIDVFARGEVPLSLERAPRQEISVEAEVVEVF